MSNINEKENWLPVPDYESYYEVSDLGRVRSLDRIISDGKGGERQIIGKVLKPSSDTDGYPAVSLSKDGHSKTMRVGRLVLLAFCGPTPSLHEMCHNPGYGIKDCHLDAIRWDTTAANAADREGTRRLSDADIIEIREKKAAGVSLSELSEEYNRNPSNIGHICTGRYYTHIIGPRTFGQQDVS